MLLDVSVVKPDIDTADNEQVVYCEGKYNYTASKWSIVFLKDSAFMLCEEKYFEIYGKDPAGVTFSPYRVCPIGAHVDHNLGKVTGFAINRGVSIAYGIKMNGIVELVSLQFSKRAQWHVSEVGEKQNDWADYLRGAVWALSRKHRLTFGISGVIEGSLPIGGLSSSAAVVLAFLQALCSVNGIRLNEAEYINTAYEAEKSYVGINIGKLDQSCEVLSKKDNLLFLDCFDNSYKLIPAAAEMKPYKFAVFFSGLGRSLVGSEYNKKTDELRSGIYAVKAFAGLEYGKLAETNARDIPYDLYAEYRDRLPVPWRKRCEHWFTEVLRAERGAEAWKNGDIEEYGRLTFESGWSSIHNWESGAPEQIKLYDIMRETKGIYGGRFAGAGFKGCCIALIDPLYEESVIESVTGKYLDAFPMMKGKYSAHICESADGVEV